MVVSTYIVLWHLQLYTFGRPCGESKSWGQRCNRSFMGPLPMILVVCECFLGVTVSVSMWCCSLFWFEVLTLCFRAWHLHIAGERYRGSWFSLEMTLMFRNVYCGWWMLHYSILWTHVISQQQINMSFRWTILLTCSGTCLIDRLKMHALVCSSYFKGSRFMFWFRIAQSSCKWTCPILVFFWFC